MRGGGEGLSQATCFQLSDAVFGDVIIKNIYSLLFVLISYNFNNTPPNPRDQCFN